VDVRVTGESAPAERDTEWHSRLVAGDEAALGEVYEAFARLVMSLAYRVVGDRDAAGDVTQEVFVQLWQRPLAYDPDRGSLRAWLALLAHRRAVDWVRREERRRRLPVAAMVSAEAPPADDVVEAAELARRVRQGVLGLPDALRVAVELAFYQGLTYRQIADELGIPEGTAKSRMRSALRRLGRGLADQAIGSGYG
jgi:RNA polymerase sigma-70 factor (ECF subfamily)